MEILFLGIILVGLMVYVSTRIKKTAASAFERESIEREDFRIVKPEGFINPIDENSRFAFEAYSKEFGKNDAEELRQAEANLIVSLNSDFGTIIEEAKASAGKILSEKITDDLNAGQRICLIESDDTKAKVAVRKFYKFIENNRRHKIYQLQISILDAYREEYADKADEMLESFVLT